MYIPTPYFRNVPKMGDLTLDNIFLDDGYPVLFTCTNEEKIYLLSGPSTSSYMLSVSSVHR